MFKSSDINAYYNKLFSDDVRKRFETVIISISIFGFVMHLFLIWLIDLDLISFGPFSKSLLRDPVSAIYTPFSFILVYEVFLLVFYLPRSITFYIGKQYEIVSLIVIRRIFKDISNMELTLDWFSNNYNERLLYDSIGIIICFSLILFFYRLSRRKYNIHTPEDLNKFIKAKQITSMLLLPSLVIMAIYSLVVWIAEIIAFQSGQVSVLPDVNNIFYNEFFTLLILIDVLLLLISFRYTDNYGQLMRNSGFIISTILIKLSFSSTGLLNIIIVCFAIAFGVLFLAIYNKYLRLEGLPKS